MLSKETLLQILLICQHFFSSAQLKRECSLVFKGGEVIGLLCLPLIFSSDGLKHFRFQSLGNDFNESPGRITPLLYLPG